MKSNAELTEEYFAIAGSLDGDIQADALPIPICKTPPQSSIIKSWQAPLSLAFSMTKAGLLLNILQKQLIQSYVR